VGARVPGTVPVALFAVLVGLGASFVTVRNGSALWYSDAQSHLTIARRIIESKSPGPGQLGTVWLPGPHLFLIPFVVSTTLWSSGWGGAMAGTLCLVASAVGLYRIAAQIGIGRAGRLIALVALMANPTVLYMYTTALTEPALVAGILLTVSGLARWAMARKPPSGGELAVYAGLPAAFAVMARYEGWAMLAAGSAFVVIVGLRRKRGWRWSIRMAFCFGILPALAILAWIAYNWAVYANPLEFMTGQYSAYAQQKNLLDSGQLTSKGSIGITLWTYDWAVIETAGAVLLGCALAGLIFTVFRWGVISRRTLIIALLAVSWAFSLLSLYLGQTAINNDHTFPVNWWNNRFALSTVPLLALLTGVLVDSVPRQKFGRAMATVAVLVAIAGQNVWWSQDIWNRSAVLAEAMQSHRDTEDSEALGRYLAEHYTGGGILMDESARGNAILPYIGIPLDQYDIRASGASFDEALKDPAAHDKWILATVATPDAPLDTGPPDMVALDLAKNPSLADRYRIVQQINSHALYQRIDVP
jgi:hypothetical protein